MFDILVTGWASSQISTILAGSSAEWAAQHSTVSWQYSAGSAVQLTVHHITVIMLRWKIFSLQCLIHWSCTWTIYKIQPVLNYYKLFLESYANVILNKRDVAVVAEHCNEAVSAVTDWHEVHIFWNPSCRDYDQVNTLQQTINLLLDDDNIF